MKGVQKENIISKDNLPSTDNDSKPRRSRRLSIPMIPVSQSFDIQAADYQVLNNGSDEIEFEDFLSSLEIDCAELPIASLLKLFNQEMSRCAMIKWSRVDHALEKLLQWPANGWGTEFIVTVAADICTQSENRKRNGIPWLSFPRDNHNSHRLRLFHSSYSNCSWILADGFNSGFVLT